MATLNTDNSEPLPEPASKKRKYSADIDFPTRASKIKAQIDALFADFATMCLLQREQADMMEYEHAELDHKREKLDEEISVWHNAEKKFATALPPPEAVVALNVGGTVPFALRE